VRVLTAVQPLHLPQATQQDQGLLPVPELIKRAGGQEYESRVPGRAIQARYRCILPDWKFILGRKWTTISGTTMHHSRAVPPCGV
jgi:hypothetical protein